MPADLHVIFGTGPVGCWTARALREQSLPVRAVNRTGRRPDLLPADVEVVAADASDSRQATASAQGAAVVYQALNPPYHEWHRVFPALQSAVLAAARAAGARYVSIENLYMYRTSTPITEDSPTAPRSKKGDLRAGMAEEIRMTHARGDIRATTLRSSDYYGPGVLGSTLGQQVFGNLVRGKSAQVVGSGAIPHSFAYIEDVGRAAAVISTHDEAFGKVWLAPHAPARTHREMIDLACRALAIPPRMTVVSPLMMRIAGLFIPAARASVEMMYEFLEPFVVDSKRIGQAFGLEPTAIEVGIERTIRWYRRWVHNA